MRCPAPIAASSKCGDTATIRANTAGSTSPHVGSPNALSAPAPYSAPASLIGDGSYGDVVDVTLDGDVPSEQRHHGADDGGAGDAGQTARDDGELHRGHRGHRPRLQVAQAGATLHDGHLYR